MGNRVRQLTGYFVEGWSKNGNPPMQTFAVLSGKLFKMIVDPTDHQPQPYSRWTYEWVRDLDPRTCIVRIVSELAPETMELSHFEPHANSRSGIRHLQMIYRNQTFVIDVDVDHDCRMPDPSSRHESFVGQILWERHERQGKKLIGVKLLRRFESRSCPERLLWVREWIAARRREDAAHCEDAIEPQADTLPPRRRIPSAL